MNKPKITLTLKELTKFCHDDLMDGGSLSTTDNMADLLKAKYPEMSRKQFLKDCGYDKVVEEENRPAELQYPNGVPKNLI
jgi:hypothetical protein